MNGEVRPFRELVMRMARGNMHLALWLEHLAAAVVRTELELTDGLEPHQLTPITELENKLGAVVPDAELRKLYLKTLRATLQHGKRNGFTSLS
jgi:hypothetical protein